MYQHITDQVLELLLKSKLSRTDQSAQNDPENNLTFEEQNALRYIGGYIIHSLHQKTKDSDVKHVQHELKDEDSTDGPAQEWVYAIDQGGLTKITTKAYRFLMPLKCVFDDTSLLVVQIKWIKLLKQN